MNSIPLLFLLAAGICEVVAALAKEQRIGWMQLGFAFFIFSFVVTGVISIGVK